MVEANDGVNNIARVRVRGNRVSELPERFAGTYGDVGVVAARSRVSGDRATAIKSGGKGELNTKMA